MRSGRKREENPTVRPRPTGRRTARPRGGLPGQHLVQGYGPLTRLGRRSRRGRRDKRRRGRVRQVVGSEDVETDELLGHGRTGE
jgi:hypothetical protein